MTGTVAERRGGRLPAEVTSFIGRRGELAEIRRLLGESRLVTLAGPGGVGKTRIAVRAATDAARSFTDGAWFVDLASLTAAELLPHTVAEALGMSGTSSVGQLDALVDHLADKQLLVVLDTCEHLVDACAMLAEVLLRAAPGLRVLTTSRQPLDVAGEHTVMIAPLERPDPDREDGAPAGEASESVLLFADRAAAIVSGWTVTPANRSAVARLCNRLDGIPLAIELAAVQLRAFSVEQIVDRLDERFLSARGRRTNLGRHQTLRAAIGWSHELCTPEERRLWARLAVFAGDFEFTAVEGICCDATLPAVGIDLPLAGLIEKSILLRVDDESGVRYRMLDTIREYGAERLAELGETPELELRHLRWYAGLAIAAQAGYVTAEQSRWLARVRRETANIRVALEYALRAPDRELLLRTGLAMGRFWILQGMIGEGRLWADRALERSAGMSGALHAEALTGGAALAALQNDLDAARAYVAAAERVELGTDDDREVRAYRCEVGALIALYEGDMPRSKALSDQAWELHGEPVPSDILKVIGRLIGAAARAFLGEFGAARELAAQIEATHDEMGEQWCWSHTLLIVSVVDILEGAPEDAVRVAEQALRMKRELNDRLGITIALDQLALCSVTDYARAARLIATSDRMRRTLGMTMFGHGYNALRQLYESRLRTQFGDAAYEAEYAIGAVLDLDDVVAYALGEDTVPVQAGASVARRCSDPLTRREREIAELVAQGLSNREIAARLVVAKRTADSHLEHILAKLHFTSRSQVAAWVAGQRESAT